MKKFLVGALLLGLSFGCTRARTTGAEQTAESSSKTPASPVAVTQAVKKKSQPAQKAKQKTKKGIKWSAPIQWESWADGRARAAKEGKPLCLLIYTNWCPRCRELAPNLNDGELVELSKKFVMVKQDQGERPEWLAQYGQTGSYVPRVLFFGLDGQLKTDITSGNSKYPNYYSPRGIGLLKNSMKKILGG